MNIFIKKKKGKKKKLIPILNGLIYTVDLIIGKEF